VAMTIPYLEMPITYICSLHCDGCSAYSNYNIKRTVPLAEAWQSLKEWSKRIEPGQFRILGGEPFLHPNLPEIILSVRQYWPAAHIQVCTNGLNLDRHPLVPFILAQTNISLSLSLHSRDAEYVVRINAAIATINGWIAEFGIEAQIGDNVAKWNRFYQGIGKYMEPFDGDVVTSWKVCHS
jgi:molybdenum cofactor biosynthesis enzyme MoaA